MLCTRRCRLILGLMGLWFVAGATDICVAQIPAKPPVFDLPEGVEPVFWPPMPKSRVLPVGVAKGGAVVKGFQMAAQPEKHQAEILEPIELQVQVRNATHQELVLMQTGWPLLNFNIEVKNEKGEVMPLTMYGKAELKFDPCFAWSEAKLKSGETRKYAILVNQYFDMTLSGSYFITIKKHIGNQQDTAELTSNTVQVDVFPHGHLPKSVVSKMR